MTRLMLLMRYLSGVSGTRTLLATALFCVASSVPAQTEVDAKSNVYQAGGAVRTDGKVNGDFFGLGGSVNIDDPVTGAASVAGGNVQIHAPVGSDLRAAGGHVTLDGEVSGRAMIAAGNVTLTRRANVAGRAWIAGGNVIMNGKIGKDLEIRAGKVVIDGEVNGDTHIMAREIDVLSGANLNGSLSYFGERAVRIDPQARVAGAVTRETSKRDAFGQPRTSRSGWRFRLTWLLGFIVAGTLFVLIFPVFTRTVQQRLGSAPWPSLGVGAAVIFAVPVVAIALILTIIGIPVALGLLAVYGVVLLAGYLITADFIGERALEALRKDGAASTAWRIAALVCALVALALLGFVPFVGRLLVFAALLFGVGALTLQLFRPKAAVPQ